MKGSQFLQNKAEHVCIYSKPGGGKSTLVMELLQHGFKLKYFSIDAGIPTSMFNGGNPRPYTEDELSRLEVFILRDTAKFPVGIQTSRKVVSGARYNLCDIHGQIECSMCKRQAETTFSEVSLAQCGLDTIAVFDHLTNLSNSALNTCWDGEAFVESGENVVDDKTNSSFTTWRQQGWLLNDFLTKVQVAPFHVIVLAEEMMAIFDDKSKEIVPHAGTKDFSSNSASYFGHVIYGYIQNGQHKWGSSSTYKSGVLTKSRTHFKIEDMKEASLAPIFGSAEELARVEVKHSVSAPEVNSKSAEQKQSGTGSSIAALKAKMLEKK